MSSSAWANTFRVLFRLAPNRLAMWLAKRRLRLVPVAEVVITGRKSGVARSCPLTLLEFDGAWYVGHPNGHSQWVLNLLAAGSALVVRGCTSTVVRATELAAGLERDAAIRATAQQPFPANLVYRAGRRHVTTVGTYFRLEPVANTEAE